MNIQRLKEMVMNTYVSKDFEVGDIKGEVVIRIRGALAGTKSLELVRELDSVFEYCKGRVYTEALEEEEYYEQRLDRQT